MIYVSVGRYNMLMSVFVQFDNKYDVELYLCASLCVYDPLLSLFKKYDCVRMVMYTRRYSTWRC